MKTKYGQHALKKFNENHDAQGRFSSGEGAQSAAADMKLAGEKAKFASTNRNIAQHYKQELKGRAEAFRRSHEIISSSATKKEALDRLKEEHQNAKDSHTVAGQMGSDQSGHYGRMAAYELAMERVGRIK